MILTILPLQFFLDPVIWIIISIFCWCYLIGAVRAAGKDDLWIAATIIALLPIINVMTCLYILGTTK